MGYRGLRDSLERIREAVRTHGVYTMSPSNHDGMEKRARVLVRGDGVAWRLVQ